METNTKPEAVTGRPTYYGQRMKQTAVYLTPEMIAWLKAQGSMGETIRALIEQAMKKGNPSNM